MFSFESTCVLFLSFRWRLWRGLSLSYLELGPKATCLKFENEIMTTVTLSKVRLSRAFLSTYSTPNPLCLCTLDAVPSFTLFQTHCSASLFESLSKIPSLPSTMESCSLVILKDLISGTAIMTLGFPLEEVNLASTSPKVRET